MIAEDNRRLELDVLIPTCERPAALAITLAGLAAQTFAGFRVVVSDQSEQPAIETPEVLALARVVRAAGHPVELLRHHPRRGLAEQRAFLLGRTTARYALFLDDDLLLQPNVVARMMAAMRAERCGFVGCAPIGLSYLYDERPHEQQPFQPWEGPVLPETIVPESTEWQRHSMHNAANVWHLQQRPELEQWTRTAHGESYVPYHVAWVGGCVLYDTAKLREVGGFEFWHDLPAEHAGEDVLAQLRVMAAFGGCGVLPSGVVHLELPTTVANRAVDAPRHLTVHTV